MRVTGKAESHPTLRTVGSPGLQDLITRDAQTRRSKHSKEPGNLSPPPYTWLGRQWQSAGDLRLDTTLSQGLPPAQGGKAGSGWELEWGHWGLTPCWVPHLCRNMVRVRLGCLCLAGSCWEHPQGGPGHSECPSSHPCGNKSSPKRKTRCRKGHLQSGPQNLPAAGTGPHVGWDFCPCSSGMALPPRSARCCCPLSPGSCQGWSWHVGQGGLLASGSCRALARTCCSPADDPEPHSVPGC